MLRVFRTSILAKLLGFLSASLVITLLLTNLFSWVMLRRSLDQQMQYTTQHIVGPNQAAVIQNLMPTGNTSLVEQTLSKMVNESVREITVYRQDGRATFASDAARRYTMNLDPELLKILAQKEPQIRWTSDSKGRYMMSYSPVVATEVCATCHAGVKAGDIRGFIEQKTAMTAVDDLLARQTLANVGVTALLFALLLSALAWVVTRLVTRPLGAMTRVTEAIAAGRLDQHMETAASDEMGRMAQSLQRMAQSLAEVVRRVRRSAGVVESGVEQISTSTEEMARTSESQAQSVQHATVSIEEMAASIDDVANHAESLAEDVRRTATSLTGMMETVRQLAGDSETLDRVVRDTATAITAVVGGIQDVASAVDETNRTAEQADVAARDGQQAMTLTTEGMGRIDGSMRATARSIEELGRRSGEIDSILTLIQDISDQTNLLALNAAIEAARAGEAGRGFAVVADEVRKLSERSGQATRAIADLVRGIQSETRVAIASTQEGDVALQDGIRLAQQASRALEAIVASVDQTNRLMGRIQSATHAQSERAAEIDQAVGRMRAFTDRVTRTTRDQAEGGELIIQAVDGMRQATDRVASASTRQRQGSRQVVELIETLNLASHESARATGLITASSGDLQRQAMELQEMIAFFQTGEQEVAIAAPALSRPALNAGNRS